MDIHEEIQDLENKIFKYENEEKIKIITGKYNITEGEAIELIKSNAIDIVEKVNEIEQPLAHEENPEVKKEEKIDINNLSYKERVNLYNQDAKLYEELASVKPDYNTISKEQFLSLPYQERIEIYNNNKDLYQKIMN